MLLSPPSPETDTAPAPVPYPRAKLRWIICGLLFLATVINYLDRFSLGFLGPNLKAEFNWTDTQFGWALFAFQLAYTVFNLPWGSFMDRFGIRRGYTLAVVWWSLAAMGHAFAHGILQFGVWRALLGMGEAGSFPGGIKTLAEWFPQRERATANGIFNAGANAGAMVAPLIIGFTTMAYGWRAAFFITGAIGMVWALLWWAVYRPASEHPRLSAEERAWINQDGPHRETLPKVPWQQLLGERRAWAFILGKAFSDPMWSFFLFWLPKYLHDVLKLSDTERMWTLAGAYLVADLGSVGGGWLSSHLIRRGWDVNRARKTTMGIAALSIPVVTFAGFTHHPWLAVGLISFGLAMHQWWSSNLFTLASDMFPTEAVGTVVGMGQIGGGSTGMLIQPLIGMVLDRFHNFGPLFLIAAFSYPVAFLLVQLCAPRLGRVKLNYETA